MLLIIFHNQLSFYKKSILISLLFLSLSIKPVHIIPLKKILEKNKEIEYIHCFDQVKFEFEPLSFSIDLSAQPNTGYFKPLFIVKIPHGKIIGNTGIVLSGDKFIKEMICKDMDPYYLKIPDIAIEDDFIPKVSGRVAVIAQPGYENYFHWTTEVLGRLALLEMFNVEYDYLYVSQKSKYMRETLQLWGIPEEKIIDPVSDDFIMRADEVILPSLVMNTNHGYVQLVNYVHPYILNYVKNKLSTSVNSKSEQSFSKKIFISRNDTNIRRVLNEDEFFDTLKNYGFERYELSKLSVADQIRLFRQAEIIISPQGTGLANSIYCKSDVKIIELYQGLCDTAIFYMMQMLGLDYIPIQTIPFEKDFYKAYFSDTYMPLSVVNKILRYI